MYRIACFVCSEMFNCDCSEIEAERIQFCSPACNRIFTDWCRQFEHISLTRFYLMRKHAKIRNGKDILNE